MMTLNAPVRLTATEAALQPEIGERVGRVVDIAGDAVLVRWGTRRAWVAREKVEQATW